jgi:hypothetical protein
MNTIYENLNFIELFAKLKNKFKNKTIFLKFKKNFFKILKLLPLD